MHIEELATQVVPLSRELIAAAQKRFDNLIKPVGSLAQLEEMTSRYAAIVGSSDKQLVVVPSVRILLLWGTERCKDQIEAILLGKAPVLALAEQVRAKVLPQFLTSENMYDYLEEGAMLTSEYVREEKAGVLCQGCFSPSPAPERWRPLVAEEDGLRFLEELGEPESYTTREQAIVWLIDLLNECAPHIMENISADYKETFEDINQVAEEAREKVQIAYQLNLIEDQGRGILNPKALLTRAELDRILAQLSEQFTEEDFVWSVETPEPEPEPEPQVSEQPEQEPEEEPAPAQDEPKKEKEDKEAD